MGQFPVIILLVVSLAVTGVWSQNAIPTVRACYQNKISFADIAEGRIDFPLGPVERKSCACFISWNPTDPNVTSTTVRVTLLGMTRVTGQTCNTRLQMIDPSNAYRLLCSYDAGAFTDLPIREYRKRMVFIQEAGQMTMSFQLQDSGCVTIDCGGIPLPDANQTTTTDTCNRSTVTPTQSTRASTQPTSRSTATPTVATTRSTAAPIPSTAAPTQSTAAPTQSTAARTQSTVAPTQSTAVPTQSTAAPTQSTAAPTQSTAARTQSTAAPTQSTAAPTQSTAAPTQSTAAPRSPPPATSIMTTNPKTSPGMTTRMSCPVHGTTAPASEMLEFLTFLEEIKLMKMKICLCKFLKKEFSQDKEQIRESQTFHMQQKSQHKKKKAWNSAFFTHLWFASKKKDHDGEVMHWNN